MLSTGILASRGGETVSAIFVKKPTHAMDKHALRIGIFNSTLSLLRQGWYTAPSGRKVDLPSVKEVIAANGTERK